MRTLNSPGKVLWSVFESDKKHGSHSLVCRTTTWFYYLPDRNSRPLKECALVCIGLLPRRIGPITQAAQASVSRLYQDRVTTDDSDTLLSGGLLGRGDGIFAVGLQFPFWNVLRMIYAHFPEYLRYGSGPVSLERSKNRNALNYCREPLLKISRKYTV